MQPRAILAQGELSDDVQAYAAACASLVDAAKATLGIQAMTQEFDIPGGGTVRVESMMNTTRVIVDIDGEARVAQDVESVSGERAGQTSRLIWLPRGFVVTPKTEDAPTGYGLDAAGQYVPGGKINQVIVNRDADNYYPDAQFERLGRGDLDAEPVFFTSESEQQRPIGIQDETLLPQLTDNRLVLSSEFINHQGWFCHRPEIVPYIDGGDEPPTGAAFVSTLLKWIFAYTNAIRVALGKSACLPPLRGLYDAFAGSTLYEMQRASTQAHNSLRYRIGYQKYSERAARCGAVDALGSGENLVTMPSAIGQDETLEDYRKRVAMQCVQAWVASPAHFANMTEDRTDAKTHEFLELAAGNGTVRWLQSPPYTEDGFDETDVSPPIAGTMAVQIFRGRNAWVDFGTAHWRGDVGVVSWSPGHNPCSTQSVIDLRELFIPTEGIVGVHVNGHTVELTKATLDAYAYVAGAGLHARDGRQYVCAIVVRAPYDINEKCSLELHECEIGGSQRIVATRELEFSAFEVGVAIFSPNGKKAVVRVSSTVQHPNNYLMWNERDFNKTATISHPGYGSKLEFIEFIVDQGTSSVVHTSQEDIEIEAYTLGAAPGFRENHFIQDADTTFKWMASYDNSNSIVYANVHVQIHTAQEHEWHDDGGPTTASVGRMTDNLGAGAASMSYFGEIIFPNGSKMTYMDVHGSFATADGYFLRFAYLDINRPESSVYARCDITPRESPPSGYAHKELATMVKMGDEAVLEFDDCGQEFNEAYDRKCMTGADIAEQAPFMTYLDFGGNPQFRTVHPIGWSAMNTLHSTDPYRPGSQLRANVCRVSHAMRLDDAGELWSPMATEHSLSVAPSCISAITSTELVARDITHDDERIRMCLWYRSGAKATTSMKANLFGPVSKGYPRESGQTVSKVLSSINLKEIIGLDDLDDDLLPMGVI